MFLENYIKNFSENPATWLQKNDSVNTDKIKLIQPIYWKQGFCIDVDDCSSYNPNTKYLMLLYDEKRTENFLSFVRGWYLFIEIFSPYF